MEFEWRLFLGFNTLQLSEEVKRLLLRLDETPENFTGRIIFMSMFKDISCGSKDNEKERMANAKLVSLYARRFGTREFHRKNHILCRCSTTFPVEQNTMKKNVSQMLDSYLCAQEDLEKDNCHSLVLVLKRSGTLSKKTVRKEFGIIAERMLEFAESGCPIFRATSPLSSGQLESKGHGKLSIHFAVNQETVETIFRIIVSANQLSLYGAVAKICEEYESLHERTVRPVVMGQWIVLSAIKTKVPLDSDDPVNQDLLLQQEEERIEKLSHKTNWVNSVWMHDFWMLLKMDSISWRKTLEISHNLIQWLVLNTLFQEMKQHHNRKAGSKETPKLGPYWKLQPVVCTANMELRSELCLRAETTLTLWSEFLMDHIGLWWIWTTMRQKFPKISPKNMR